MQKLSCLLILSFTLIACGSKKNMSSSSAEAKNIRSLEKKLNTKKPYFKSLTGVMSASYETEDESVNLRINFRVKKDSAIWMSAKIAGLIPVAKALITPDQVSFYQKINNEYFEGDYSLINDLFGIPVNFNQLQNLLLGQPVIDPFQQKARFSQDAASYFVSRPYDQQLSYQSAWFKNSLQLNKQQINQNTKNKQLLINYDRYKSIDGNSYPVDFFILASNIDSQVRIGVKVKKIEKVDDIRLPFSIPDNYTRMSL